MVLRLAGADSWQTVALVRRFNLPSIPAAAAPGILPEG